jgi:osmotically-inducible protein OsmY
MDETRQEDEAILVHMKAALKSNPRLESQTIRVSVSEGVLTLTGTADSWMARTTAEEAAHGVPGVLDVVVDVVVTPALEDARHDTEVAHAVRHALEWDVRVPHERVRTTISDGIVSIEGEVDYAFQRDDISRCLRDLIGVREVRNLLVVRRDGGVSAEQIRTNVENALVRRAAWTARHVGLQLSQTKVTIHGQVPSHSDREAIENAVRSTPGVADVENLLEVPLKA